MPIIYTLVTQGTAVLCEHTHENHTGNFSDIARKIISRIQDHPDSKLTYVFDGHTFNFRICSPHIFMCMADEAFGRNLPFVFLKDLSDVFFAAYKQHQGRVQSYAGFQQTMRDMMQQFESSSDNDTVTRIQKGLDEVKDVMKLNINKVLQRGDQIEVLVDKTENLSLTSDNFRLQSRVLRKNLCWANLKMKLLTVGLFLALMYLLGAGVCGVKLDQCS